MAGILKLKCRKQENKFRRMVSTANVITTTIPSNECIYQEQKCRCAHISLLFCCCVWVCTTSCVDIIIHVILCRQRFSMLLFLAMLCLLSFLFYSPRHIRISTTQISECSTVIYANPEICNSSHAYSQSLTFISNEPNKNPPYTFFSMVFSMFISFAINYHSNALRH